ncbi:MAG: cytidylate kinase family protein [Prevotella sp.]|nr:cytidylate kinase family protein [Prevotella sp.]
MKKNEQFVITINRELGSGGRTVGRLLSEKLGIPFYDKAVIKALQEKYNLTTAEIERLKGRKQNMTEEEARKTIHKVDKMHENYVKSTPAPHATTPATTNSSSLQTARQRRKSPTSSCSTSADDCFIN